MHVLAICGSRRAHSSTRKALAVALRAAEGAGAEVSWFDLGENELPFCDGRGPNEPYDDPRVKALRDNVRAADAVLIGSPEYHGSMSGALKNLLDLLGPEELRNTVVGVLATARGDAGAMNTLNHLRHVVRWMNAWVLPTQVSVPRAQERFDSYGEPDEGLRVELDKLGRELVRYGKLIGSA
ncbi:MAG: NAD(P)H-dependent oxidoreductase [Alphaproteobacteria bacterium]|nr:NAD(P)H-dependent oxidoreductase [Alphaproteobacteria bacterium]